MYHHNIAPAARSGLFNRSTQPRRTLSSPLATLIHRYAHQPPTQRYQLTLHDDDDSFDLLLTMRMPPIIFIEPDNYY